MDSVIFTRVKELCAENGITINKLETIMGMSSGAIGKWRNTAIPTIDKISKIAEYFKVSYDYILGASEFRSTVDELLKDRDFISLQRARERLSEQDKKRMMVMLKAGFDHAFAGEDIDLSVLLDT